MLDKIKELTQTIEAFSIDSKEQLEQFRLEYLSKKGKITSMFDGFDFKTVAPEIKKSMGQEMNKLKVLAQTKFEEIQEKLNAGGSDNSTHQKIDTSLPPIPNELGGRHPISVVREQIYKVFERMGFSLSDGPEIEDDFHNFTA